MSKRAEQKHWRDRLSALEAQHGRGRESPCWIPELRPRPNGYVFVKWDGHTDSMHRRSYEHYHGSIPEGKHIDHLCRRRACCNPDHLEAVTPRTNLLRSEITLAAQNAEKTECPAGHAYSVHGFTRADGARECRLCNCAKQKRYYQRNREREIAKATRRYQARGGAESQRAYKAANREKVNASQQEYRRANKDELNRKRREHEARKREERAQST